MTDTQIFAVCVITAAVAGALVCVLIAGALAGAIVKAWMPDLPEFMVVDSVTLNSAIEDEDGVLVHRNSLTVKPRELSVDFVERWLDRRQLVMSPKGKDFRVPLKKAGGA